MDDTYGVPTICRALSWSWRCTYYVLGTVLAIAWTLWRVWGLTLPLSWYATCDSFMDAGWRPETPTLCWTLGIQRCTGAGSGLKELQMGTLIQGFNPVPAIAGRAKEAATGGSLGGLPRGGGVWTGSWRARRSLPGRRKRRGRGCVCALWRCERSRTFQGMGLAHWPWVQNPAHLAICLFSYSTCGEWGRRALRREGWKPLTLRMPEFCRFCLAYHELFPGRGRRRETWLGDRFPEGVSHFILRNIKKNYCKDNACLL